MTTYQVTIKGRTSPRLDEAFQEWHAVSDVGVTHLVGDVRDQSELYGLIERLRDLGIELIALRPTTEATR